MIPALTRRPNQTKYYSHQYLFISILRPLCQMHLVGEKEIHKKKNFVPSVRVSSLFCRATQSM
jgi:hypothetical protein